MRRLFALLATLGALPLFAAASPGLSVSPSGQLLLTGQPFAGLGVNYYDLFTRHLGPRPRTNDDAGLRDLAARKIPFARFSAGAYWPAEWGLYRTNRAEYFARFDAVVHHAERHGIGLIPSLFWQLSTVPDLVGEPCQRWGETNSRTHAFLREYTREVVTRYQHSPAIWAWEFGNEYNLPSDLPNAAQHRPPVVPGLGTPDRRGADDEITHADFRIALREFALEVRRHDSTRALISGNAFPRVSAWHQAREKSWKKDTREQFAEMLAADNPSPLDTLSVRAYDLATDVGRLAQAMEVAQRLRKPLFVGEFGVPAPTTEVARKNFQLILTALETNQIPFAALWVYDFAGQAKGWNVRPDNDRAWQLEAIEKFNERLRRRPSPAR